MTEKTSVPFSRATRSLADSAAAVRPVQTSGAATRQSTDILAINDPDFAAAVRFIRERACEGINVADLLREVPLTRRDLGNRFRKSERQDSRVLAIQASRPAVSGPAASRLWRQLA